MRVIREGKPKRGRRETCELREEGGFAEARRGEECDETKGMRGKKGEEV